MSNARVPHQPGKSKPSIGPAPHLSREDLEKLEVRTPEEMKRSGEPIARKYGFSKDELTDALKNRLPVAYSNFPYSVVIAAALDRIPNLPGLHRIVLRVLIERLGQENRCCWPSQRTIARESGASIRTVRRVMTLAQKRGWATVVKVQIGNVINYNEYRFFQALVDDVVVVLS